ncbi:RNA polymerase sigma factor [Spirosoma litoris]
MAKQSTNHCADYPNDDILLTALKKRMEQAMRCLYSRSQKKIVTSLARRGNSLEDAEDAFQDGATALWQNIDRVYIGAKLNTILHGYVFNKWKEIRRRKGREGSWPEAELPYESPEPNPEENLIDLDMQELLRKGINQLDPKCRELLDLLIFQQKTPEEAAEILGCSVNYVYTNKWRCIQKLRKLL